MKKTGRTKTIALGITFLLVASTLISYAVINQLPATAYTTPDPLPHTIVMTTDNPTPNTIIKAGPTQGYEPLTVHFYGNPANQSNITSYTWTFGPQGSDILTKDGYTEITTKPYLKLNNLVEISFFLIFPLSMFINPFGFPILPWAILIITNIVTAIRQNRDINSHRTYASTQRAPTMIFLTYGSYSATLTVTYTNGTTASDTVWITVLQVYHPPPPDNDDNNHDTARTRLQDLRPLHYISRRT